MATYYRPDVDGMRALAVLSVILFHINETLLPGGFIGVDVFFVISGFLISRNILVEIDAGCFSLLEFYRRRVKRIAPAMLVVVSVTLILSQMVMLPTDAEHTAESALWSVASLANVYFWLYHDESYFAAAAHDSPLLHMWSLGVEEQFYVLWPLLLLLTAKASRNRLFIAGIVAAAGFFFLGQATFRYDPSFSYYMLPTRAGELLLGALAAVAVLRGFEKRIPDLVVTPLALAGMALVCAPLFLVSEDDVFPGFLAVPSTLGTALVILSGHCRSNIVSRALSLRPLVQIGLISYSAYLWHWPLLAFYRYGRPETGVITGVALVTATFLLAWTTYQYIEKPARCSKASAWRIMLRMYAVPAGAIGIIALTGMKLDGYSLRSGEYVAELKHLQEITRPAFQHDYVCQNQTLTIEETKAERCVLGPETTDGPHAILWGDSNAAHYVGMLGVIANKVGFRFRNFEIGSCPPVFSDPERFVESRRLADCRAAIPIVREALRPFDVVIVSAAWTSYESLSDDFLPAFFETVHQLVKSGKMVLIIGKAPTVAGYDRRCRAKALAYPFLECPVVRRVPDLETRRVNALLRRFAIQSEDVEYFDVIRYLCPDDVCSSDVNGRPIYFDPDHLTMAASWELGTTIVRDDVPAQFVLISEWPSEMKAGL